MNLKLARIHSKSLSGGGGGGEGVIDILMRAAMYLKNVTALESK